MALTALLLEIQQARYGQDVAAREIVLREFRGYRASSVASATGSTVHDVRRWRAEGGRDPDDGESPFPEAGPEDGPAYVVWLHFGQRMPQNAIAAMLGVKRQRVNQIVKAYLDRDGAPVNLTGLAAAS